MGYGRLAQRTLLLPKRAYITLHCIQLAQCFPLTVERIGEVLAPRVNFTKGGARFIESLQNHLQSEVGAAHAATTLSADKIRVRLTPPSQ